MKYVSSSKRQSQACSLVIQYSLWIHKVSISILIQTEILANFAFFLMQRSIVFE